MIVREDDFTCAATIADQVKRRKITVRFNTESVEAGGESMVSFARFQNNRTGKNGPTKQGKTERSGIFVFAGYVPNTAWMDGKVDCDKAGLPDYRHEPEENVDGVYGAGDVCIKNLRTGRNGGVRRRGGSHVIGKTRIGHT